MPGSLRPELGAAECAAREHIGSFCTPRPTNTYKASRNTDSAIWSRTRKAVTGLLVTHRSRYGLELMTADGQIPVAHPQRAETTQAMLAGRTLRVEEAEAWRRLRGERERELGLARYE